MIAAVAAVGVQLAVAAGCCWLSSSSSSFVVVEVEKKKEEKLRKWSLSSDGRVMTLIFCFRRQQLQLLLLFMLAQPLAYTRSLSPSLTLLNVQLDGVAVASITRDRGLLVTVL